MATTWKSDLFDMGRYFEAKRAARAIGGTAAAAAVNRALFTTIRPTHVNTMDLCFWFLKLMADRNWPKIDAEQVEIAKTPEFINALTGAKLPVDGLQTMSGLFVHETPFICSLSRSRYGV
ncbi:hypothetical protein GE09DRAFT_1052350 [Coniochaeta sp. 2T2.1]|nr:hypothetical protein GE09DRAFT_1052350 [Coniochaeta sp. 2T2.1]